MKGMKSGGRAGRKTLLFAVVLGLIGIGTVIYKYELINLTPGYAGNGNTVAAKAPLAAASSGYPVIADPRDQSLVAIVKSKEKRAEDIQYPEIKEMVTHAVALAGGFAGLIRDGQTVVIKPNLVTPIDYTLPNWSGQPLVPEVNGTTTDYRVTRAIVELVRQYNPRGKVYVMEGSSFPTRQCMRQLKYTPEFIPGVDEFICIEEDSGGWRDYHSPRIVQVPVKDPLLQETVYMNKRYKNADVIISAPALKTHWTEVVSGSIKNVGIGATPATIYGGVQPGSVNRTGGLDHDKAQLDKWIHDWFMARPIQFAVIDGLQGIQNGPTPCFEMTRCTDIRQDQMNSRLIIASRDCVAADTVESLIMQWDPAAVGYLGYLEKSGAGKCNVAKIRVVGKPVDEVRQDFKGTAPQGKFGKRTPPHIEMKATVVKDDSLTLTLAADPQIVKIEAYREGRYLGTVAAADQRKWTIQLKGMTGAKLPNHVVLKCYDKYLNCTIIKMPLKENPQKHEI